MEKSNKLNLWALIAIAVGQVVGVGIINTTGLAIAEAGRATWLAYALAVILGFLWVLPVVFFASIAKYKGGNYTLCSTLLGEQAGGLYALWYMPMYLATAMVGIGLGNYVHALIPAIPAKAAGFVLLTFFYVINLNGISLMAKAQKIMTAMLIVALAIFAVGGAMQVNEGALNLSDPAYFMGGSDGFFGALVLLIYSTSGHALVAGFSWDAKRPKKDVPLAIIIATFCILALYVGVSFAAANVLPVEEVAGQPLTTSAKKIFPYFIYVLFTIGGPILALTTTLNSGFAALTAPILGGVRNGWLPTSIAKTNKAGSPYILYTTMYLIGVLPLLFGVPLNKLTNYTVITQRITTTLTCIAMFMIPIKFKDAWKKSWLHMPDPVFYAIAVLALATQAFAVVISARELGAVGFITNIAVVAVLAAIGLTRYKMGLVHSKTLCVIGDEDDE